MTEAWTASTARIAGFYRALIAQHRHGPQALDYGGRETQRGRFEVQSQVMPLAGKRVLDVGCGFADYAAFLQAKFGAVDYSGVDITPEMIAEARRRHPALSLRHLDILAENPGGPFDLVTANGIFYLMGDDAPAMMQRLIARMFALCREAVSFSSLSTWATRRADGEFHADPLATLEFCRTLTPWVVLRHDYHPGDFTIYMYRDRRP